MDIDHFTINMGRTLTTHERNRVLYLFLEWAEEQGFDRLPIPSVTELRWNDAFTELWVSKLSGLVEHGFFTLYPEHKPLVESDKWAIYSDANPAARFLLETIRDVTHPRLEKANG